MILAASGADEGKGKWHEDRGLENNNDGLDKPT